MAAHELAQHANVIKYALISSRMLLVIQHVVLNCLYGL
jgi:hypothetical protein